MQRVAACAQEPLPARPVTPTQLAQQLQKKKSQLSTSCLFEEEICLSVVYPMWRGP